jgi:predicted amidophosphoribosyltransferase
MTAEHRRPGAFVWPPKPIEDVPGEPDAGLAIDDAQWDGPRGLTADAETWVRGWRLFERSVLGASLPAVPPNWVPPDDTACMRCAGTVGEGETDASGCAACRGKRLAWSRAVRLGAYDGTLRDGIIACKYQSDRESGRRIASLLGEQVATLIADDLVLREASARGIRVVPVATTLARRLGNGGLDHALELARGVARSLGTEPDLMLQRKRGPRQARSLSVAERARNVAGAFAMRTGRTPPMAGTLVLVDDVRTTGATAAACFRALASAYGLGGPKRKPESSVGPIFVLATAAVSESRRAKTAIPGHPGGSGSKS